MHINVDISYSTTKGQKAVLPRPENNIWIMWLQYFQFCSFLHSEPLLLWFLGFVGEVVAINCSVLWLSAPEQDENCPFRGKRAKEKMST